MKRTTLPVFLLATVISLTCACTGNSGDDMKWLENAVDRSRHQLKMLSTKFENDNVFPRSIKNGEYKLVNQKDWTSGFFPGSLWLAYELNSGSFYREQAEAYTAKLDGIQFYKGTHDLGFMVFCSFGNQFRLTADPYAEQAILDASESLCSRIDENIGLIRSWDFGNWNYPVIIDNMMNLEMLFWASRHYSDPKYREAAIRHADLTMEHHFRDDYSSYHVISYNADGTVESKGTFQGYSDPSAWARGQAWGLYGYVMCYRETGLERYLEQARHIADYIMTHPNTPEDLIPYWDYDAPEIPDAPRDASAAAIISSALLEMSTHTSGEESQSYFDYAETILKNLCTDKYLAPADGNGGFIIMHCVGHLPASSEIDTPLNYADYYFLESIKRYAVLKGVDLATL